MPETAHKYVLAETVFNLYALTMPETAQKYELPFLRARRKVDISRDSLEFLCISLWRRLLKGMRTALSEHARRMFFRSICHDMGIVQVINGDWSATFVSIFKTI